MEALKCWKCRHGHIYDFSDCGGGKLVDCDHPLAERDMEFDINEMTSYPDCYEEGDPTVDPEDATE